MTGEAHPTAPLETLLHSTLVVDRDKELRLRLKQLLERLGHEVAVVADGATAIAEATRQRFSCIFLEVHDTGSGALDLIPALLEREPHAAIIVLSEITDPELSATAIQLGAMAWLQKPVQFERLEQVLGHALSRRRDVINQDDTLSWLQHEVVQRGAELHRERRTLEQVSIAALEALINALEAKDLYLRGHSARVADLAAMVAATLGLPDEQVERVRMAGRLHDIGKIGIRESVLGKKGALTPAEFAHIKTHVLIGVQILAPLTHLRDVIAIVRSHHERADGSGYPDGLAGEDIPIGSRILGAAEVYDALTTARPYQEKMTPDEAVARMRDLVGTVVAKEVHAALATVIAKRGALEFIDERHATNK